MTLRLTLAGAMLAGCRSLAPRPPEPVARRQPVVAAKDRGPDEDSGQTATESDPVPEEIITKNLQQGRLEAANGRPGQAAQFYQRVLRLDPDNAVAQQRLGALTEKREGSPSERQLAARTEATDGSLSDHGGKVRTVALGPLWQEDDRSDHQAKQDSPLLPWTVVQRPRGGRTARGISPIRLTAAVPNTGHPRPPSQTPTPSGTGHLPLWSPSHE